jgi:hypothetical protein
VILPPREQWLLMDEGTSQLTKTLADAPVAKTVRPIFCLCQGMLGSLARCPAFGYDSARHALPRPGGSGPRDPRESPAGDASGILPGASGRHRTDPARSSRGPCSLRPEPPSGRGLPHQLRRHLWLGRARDGAVADLRLADSAPPGSPPCFIIATPDETTAPLASALVRAGRAGSGPLMDRRAFLATLAGVGPGTGPKTATARRAQVRHLHPHPCDPCRPRRRRTPHEARDYVRFSCGASGGVHRKEGYGRVSEG